MQQSVELFDVTLRDGSYMVDFQFDYDDVVFLFPRLEAIGLRYIEVGHGFGLSASKVKGRAAASDEEYLEAAASSRTSARFGTFFIPGIGEEQALRRARERYGMDFVRVGLDAPIFERCAACVAYAKELGYEVMANAMKTTLASPMEVARKSAELVRHGADAIYVVDSAGGMLPRQVGEYVRAVAEYAGVRVGFHGHNNLELALANAIATLENGGTLIDCSIGGLGRSAGNTRTELLIPVLRRLGLGSRYDYFGAVEVWETVVEPILRRRRAKSLQWASGYADIHSGLLTPFVALARERGLRLDALLMAYGDALCTGDVPELSALAEAVAAAPRCRTSCAQPGEDFLRLPPRHRDPAVVRNTFQSVEAVLDAVNALAVKACLPVAAVIRIDPAPPGEDYVMAEYLYHDEQFVFLRVLLGSPELFLELLRRHGKTFDILLFDALPDAVWRLLDKQRTLTESLACFHVDIPAIHYRYLFAAADHACRQAGADRVLLCGADPDVVSRHLPGGLEGIEAYCLAGDAVIMRFDARQRSFVPLPPGDGRLFPVAAVLSRIDGDDGKALGGFLAPGAMLLDFTGGMPEAIGTGNGRQTVSLSPYKALSGELVNLMAAFKPSR